MVRLPDDEKSLMMICLSVSTQYRRATDRQTDGRTDILRQHSPRSKKTTPQDARIYCLPWWRRWWKSRDRCSRSHCSIPA